LLRWTTIFGAPTRPRAADLERALWWRGGLSLAIYIVAFNWALKLTALSHVALYLGAAPVWALLWEGRPRKSWKSAQRYGAAALAFCGVLVLFLPLLRNPRPGSILGELIGIACGVLWTNYGVQCRSLGRHLSGAELCGHTFLRAGLLLAPLAMIELSTTRIPWRLDLVLIQLFCVLGGGVCLLDQRPPPLENESSLFIQQLHSTLQHGLGQRLPRRARHPHFLARHGPHCRRRRGGPPLLAQC
jgi:drug/metabolite transporter (DMT)-like permease